VPDFAAFFGKPIRVAIPEELANETTLLAYLDVSARELKKIVTPKHLLSTVTPRAGPRDRRSAW
jgi:hypothetical protein